VNILIIGYLQQWEKEIREYAKSKGVKIRHSGKSIKLYYTDGSVYEGKSWSYIIEIINTGKVLLHDGTEYIPIKLK
jgi:hypothetical protein